MKREYLNEMIEANDKISDLTSMTQDHEKIIQREKLKYVFQRFLFISSVGRKLHPRLIDFMYGRTMTDLVAFKLEN